MLILLARLLIHLSSKDLNQVRGFESYIYSHGKSKKKGNMIKFVFSQDSSHVLWRLD